ncbi:MAG: cell division protein SepF [Candidatus Bathyarchaeia archaeon]
MKREYITVVERRSLPDLSGIFRKPRKNEKEIATRGVSGKTYLKAMPLRDLADLDNVKNEVRSGNIMILRITPLANKSVDDVKRAVNELCEFVESIGGDIARLGEERIVVCPSNVRIWREKTPVANEPIPTAA